VSVKARLKFLTILRTVLSAVLLLQSVAAFETDQYNLPPQPLGDIGDELSEYVEQNIKKAVDKINAEIIRRQACLENLAVKRKSPNCGSAEKERARLAFLRSEEAIVREIYNPLGGGIFPFTRSATWVETHHFRATPALYKTNYLNSIYFTVPTSYLTISPTVKVYGAQFGTDKIAHFFQQGYTYYKISERAASKGSKPDEAVRKAILWGQKTERTYYGTMVSGVYSNADLAANYVGMLFYQGLTRELKIKDETRAPVLLLNNGIWIFNSSFNSRELLIKPFFTDHLNEALNPSIISNLIGLRTYVRRTVKKQSCKQWLAQNPDLTQSKFSELTLMLMRWNGEDYGFTPSKNFITIANTCFNSSLQTESSPQPLSENIFDLIRSY
jgi:hypothetical protein